MSEDLIYRLASRLDPHDPEGTAEALRSSPTFHGDLQWLERLFAVADKHPMPPVPEEVTASLFAIVEAESKSAPDDLHFEFAVLIHDSRSDKELVGVRGQAAPAAAWTAIYSTPTADLIIDGTPQGTVTAIRGHLLNRVGDQRSVQITSATIDRSVMSDSKGVFDFGLLEAGEHEMRVAASGLNFAWKLDLP